MSNKLYYNTITPLLRKVLKTVMSAGEFDAFRLVGGTALSLQRGHRASVDIDLFTDAPYGSIDFKAIDAFLRTTYPYVDTNNYSTIIGMGKSYYVGDNKDACIKLDIFYTTDEFIENPLLMDNIRLASINEIIAMKADVILRGGRKKDFWDIHELKDDYPFQQMLKLHAKRHPYNHNSKLIKNKFTDFKNADEDFDPICLRDKKWEIIKLDIIDFAG